MGGGINHFFNAKQNFGSERNHVPNRGPQTHARGNYQNGRIEGMETLSRPKAFNLDKMSMENNAPANMSAEKSNRSFNDPQLEVSLCSD